MKREGEARIFGDLRRLTFRSSVFLGGSRRPSGSLALVVCCCWFVFDACGRILSCVLSFCLFVVFCLLFLDEYCLFELCPISF